MEMTGCVRVCTYIYNNGLSLLLQHETLLSLHEQEKDKKYYVESEKEGDITSTRQLFHPPTNEKYVHVMGGPTESSRSSFPWRGHSLFSSSTHLPGITLVFHVMIIIVQLRIRPFFSLFFFFNCPVYDIGLHESSSSLWPPSSCFFRQFFVQLFPVSSSVEGIMMKTVLSSLFSALISLVSRTNIFLGSFL